MFFIQKLINNNLFKNNHIIILIKEHARTVFVSSLFLLAEKRVFEKDGIHRIKAVRINIKKNV